MNLLTGSYRVQLKVLLIEIDYSLDYRIKVKSPNIKKQTRGTSIDPSAHFLIGAHKNRIRYCSAIIHPRES